MALTFNIIIMYFKKKNHNKQEMKNVNEYEK